MKPYADLTKAEKAKDREAISDLPKYLADAGFSITRMDPSRIPG